MPFTVYKPKPDMETKLEQTVDEKLSILRVSEPSLAGNELKYITECITTNWISSQGKYVTEFENSMREFVGSQYALASASGTTALHLALAALGLNSGDEVIVPDLTFAATANVVVHCGAKPVFVDVTADTWTLDPGLIEAKITDRTRAIIPVHLYGHPCDMEPIVKIAERHNLFVIEDVAEALGAEYRGVPVGTIGDVGCFSFFANKVITTGEGGMLVTKDEVLYEKMALLADHGMSKEKRYWHPVVGFNYRMTNLQAALGVAQMERIEHFLEVRREIAATYKDGLNSLQGISLVEPALWATPVNWLYSILIDASVTGIDRDRLAEELAVEGIETRPLFLPLHSQPPYAQDTGEYPVTEELSNAGLSLPTSNGMSVEDAARVSSIIAGIIQ